MDSKEGFGSFLHFIVYAQLMAEFLMLQSILFAILPNL